MPAYLEKSAVATGLEKVSFLSNPKERQCQKCSNCHTITLISHASNVQNSPRQASTIHEPWLPDVQAGFRKGRGTRDQIANIHWFIEKAREFQKNIYFCFIDCAKAFDCVDHNKLWKILKDQTTLPASWEICMQVKNQQLELDREQRTGKGVHQGCVLPPCLFNLYTEMLGWMKHKLESRLLGDI